VKIEVCFKYLMRVFSIFSLHFFAKELYLQRFLVKDRQPDIHERVKYILSFKVDYDKSGLFACKCFRFAWKHFFTFLSFAIE